MMKLLTVQKLFGNGEITTYSKVISEKTRTTYTPPVPGSFEEKYEKYRQKVKNSRSRAATRAMSYKFRYHTVFTTENKEISHNPELFIKLVTSILKKQNINYFLVIELNHPRSIWQYDGMEDKNEGIEIDEIINKYGCYNRIALAPLSEKEGFHIHVLTNRKVNFKEWIESYGGNPKNLYSELFLYEQIDNVKYLLKYFYYTKSVVDENFHIYRSNIKRIKSKTIISEKDLDTGIVDVLYSSFKIEEEREERKLLRSLNHNLCNLNINLFSYLKENCTFYNVLYRQNVLLFSSDLFNKFVRSIYIDTDVFYKISKLSYSFHNGLLNKEVVSSDFLSFDFGSFIQKSLLRRKKAYLKSSKGYKKNVYKLKNRFFNCKRCNFMFKNNNFNKIKYENTYKLKNIYNLKPVFNTYFGNWLLKYISYIKNIPKISL